MTEKYLIYAEMNSSTPSLVLPSCVNGRLSDPVGFPGQSTSWRLIVLISFLVWKL